MSSRGWRSAVMGVALATGLAFVPAGLVISLASPAGAAETTFNDTCADVYGHPSGGDLDKTTDPVAGSPVASGQEVDVTVKWPTFAVAGPRNHRLMECVSVDGHAAQLAADRQFTSAEGTMSLAETIPTGLASGSTVCGQSFLKTQGSFGPVTRWSQKTCYPVGNAASFHALSRVPSPPGSSAPPPSSSKSPDNRTTPSTRGPYSSPPGSGDYKAPWPPWEKEVRPPTTSPPVVVTPTTVAPTAKAAPRTASGTQSAAPATQAPVRQPSQTLPRTGAGIIVLLAVAAVALFSGRTLQKASDHIAENRPVPAVPIDDGDEDEPTLILGRRW
jgi:F0F1-type ATP synthase membrane subunit c/vacuolar-type H+-ATPase subunit K